MDRRIYLAVLIVFICFSISKSNEPSLPPYYKYFISGTIVSDTIPGKANYALQLFGKDKYRQRDFLPLYGLGTALERPITFSDSLGNFMIVVSNGFPLDSLKIGIIQHGKQPVFSRTYFIDPNKLIPINVTHYDDFGKPGCKGCSENEVAASYDLTDHYEYYFDRAVVIL